MVKIFLYILTLITVLIVSNIILYTNNKELIETVYYMLWGWFSADLAKFFIFLLKVED